MPIETMLPWLDPRQMKDSQHEAEDGKGGQNRKKLGPHRYLFMHRLIDCACLDKG